MPLTQSPSQGRLVQAGDTKLFVVERAQEGRPLLVLHGGPGLDHHEFSDYLDPLGPDVRVILVDLRAQGMSEPAPPETWTLAQMATDIVELAGALELSDWTVLGHSFGGFVALQLAVDHPDAPAGVIASSTLASMRWLEGIDERIAAVEPPELREQIRWGWDHEGDPAQAQAAFEAQLPFHFGDLQSPLIEEYKLKVAATVYRPEVGEHFSSSGFEGLPYGHRLGDVRAPLLVLAGRLDRTCPLGASEEIAAAVPGSEFVVLERSGHMGFVEEQDDYLRAVRRFMLAAR
jgi:proline iminopeptidase